MKEPRRTHYILQRSRAHTHLDKEPLEINPNLTEPKQINDSTDMLFTGKYQSDFRVFSSGFGVSVKIKISTRLSQHPG